MTIRQVLFPLLDNTVQNDRDGNDAARDWTLTCDEASKRRCFCQGMLPLAKQLNFSASAAMRSSTPRKMGVGTTRKLPARYPGMQFEWKLLPDARVESL